MKSTREQFEEIWPVPDHIEWSDRYDGYVCKDDHCTDGYCSEWDARLETFTRCQETMAPVFSLIEEMISEFEADQIWYPWLDRAKQIMEQKK